MAEQWTDKEIEILRKYYPTGGSWAVQKHLKGRTIKAICRKAENLRITCLFPPKDREEIPPKDDPFEDDSPFDEKDVISPFDEEYDDAEKINWDCARESEEPQEKPVSTEKIDKLLSSVFTGDANEALKRCESRMENPKFKLKIKRNQMFTDNDFYQIMQLLSLLADDPIKCMNMVYSGLISKKRINILSNKCLTVYKCLREEPNVLFYEFAGPYSCSIEKMKDIDIIDID